MKNTKLLKIVISIILIFGIMFLDSIFYNNIVYAAGNGQSSLDNLDEYNGRKWRRF